MHKIFILFLAITYLRPQDIIPVFSIFKVPFALQTLFVIFGVREILKIKSNKTVFWTLLFCGLNLTTVVFVVNHHAWYTASTQLMVLLFGLIVPTIILINSTERLIIFVKAWIVIHCLLAIWVISHNGKGPGAFVADENDVALVLSMILPYPLLFLQQNLIKGKWRIIIFASLIVILLAIIATQSRGGFLGLLAVLVGYLYFNRKSIKPILAVTVLCFLGFLIIPQDFKEDLLSAADSNDNTRSDRIKSWQSGLYMFSQNPILGVGTHNYAWRIGKYERLMGRDGSTGRSHSGRVAHSLYVTLLSELGLVGTLIFFRLIYIAFSENFAATKYIPERNLSLPENSLTQKTAIIRAFAKANTVALFSFLVSGAFLSVLYYISFWFLLGLSASLNIINIKNIDNERSQSKKSSENQTAIVKK